MKSNWNNPDFKKLPISETKNLPRMILDSYEGKVSCEYCNKVFDGGKAYNKHLTRAVMNGSFIAGYECTSAPDDNVINDGGILLS